MEIVSLFACNSQLLSLNRCLHFDFGLLDHFYYFAGKLRFNSLLNLDQHRNLLTTRLDVTFLQRFDVHTSFGQFALENIQHLFDLEIHFSTDENI